MTFLRSVLLDTCVDLISRTALLFSVFALVAGHDAPGGGFVGGLVAAAALVLRYVAGGAADVGHTVRIPGSVLLGSGLVVAVVAGMAGWFDDGAFLTRRVLEVGLPVLGDVKLASTLAFDIGVYLVVVGLVVSVLGTLGSEEPS